MHLAKVLEKYSSYLLVRNNIKHSKALYLKYLHFLSRLLVIEEHKTSQMYSWMLNTPVRKDNHLSISIADPSFRSTGGLGAIEPRSGSAPQSGQPGPQT